MTLAGYARAWCGRQGAASRRSRRAYRRADLSCAHSLVGTWTCAISPRLPVRAFLQPARHGHAAAERHRTMPPCPRVLTDAMLDGHIPDQPGAWGESPALASRRGPVVQGLPLPDLHALLRSADCDRVGWFGRLLPRAGHHRAPARGDLALRPGDLLPPVSALRVDRTYHGRGAFGPPRAGGRGSSRCPGTHHRRPAAACRA